MDDVLVKGKTAGGGSTVRMSYTPWLKDE